MSRDWHRMRPVLLLAALVLPLACSDSGTSVDGTPPQIQILQPSSSGTFTTSEATLALSGTASDNAGIDRVTWSSSAGGSGQASITASGGGAGKGATSISWTAAGVPLSDGQITITVQVFDEAGNSGSATLVVQVDRSAPQVQITGPTSEGRFVTNQGSVTINGTASDNQGVTSVTWRTSDGRNGTASGTTSWQISNLSVPEGETTVTVEAKDALGNVGSDEIEVAVDQTPPQIAMTSPAPPGNFTTVSSELSASGTASDANGVAEVRWQAGGASGIATGTAEWSVASVAVPLGASTLRITAVDEAGNEASVTLNVTRLRLLGSATVSPTSVLTSFAGSVRTTVSPDPTITLVATPRIVRVDARNEVIHDFGTLFDDGDLTTHGDEILGDGVFSTYFAPPTGTAGDIRLQVIADYQEAGQTRSARSEVFVLSVFTPTSNEANAEKRAIETEAVETLKTAFQQSQNVSSALETVISSLQQKSGVKSAKKEGSSFVSIQYQSGLLGGIVVGVKSATKGSSRGGSFTPRHLHTPLPDLRVSTGSGAAADTIRATRATVPLSQQTRGLAPQGAPYATGALGAAQSDDLILNRNVLIYAPFEGAFDPHNEGPQIQQALGESALDFQVTYLRNQEATLSALNSLTQYGLIVLATHGTGGNVFFTGDVSTPAKDLEYDALRQAHQVGSAKVVIQDGSGLLVSEDVYFVTSLFVQALAGQFPNSVILNASCESTKTDMLWNAFKGRGAGAYFGFSEVVSSSFAVSTGVALVRNLVVNLQTTGEAFVSGQMDTPVSGLGSAAAEFQHRGSATLGYPTSFINGDFEDRLAGWTVQGDGRVIAKLQSQPPQDGNLMAIISTGLGFTTTSGSISQSFRVGDGDSAMRLRWNFLSEEFLEWVGSEYQDFFRVTLRPASGGVVVLFEKTIDQIHAQYDLTRVSPEIVFDQGDVYMTGWLDLTFDLSPYRGQFVTIVFEATDIGDSIYDTAVLLDAMVIN